jgi:hypothetical protein
MPYELRLAGRPPERFDSAEAAERRARDLIRADADVQIDVIDLQTGRPYAPAAAGADRDRLAGKVGF